MSEPRETARQIAERLRAGSHDIAGMDYEHTLTDDEATALIEAHVASLTADLAQARQDCEAVFKLLGERDQELEAAEQARHEALKDAQGYSEQTAQVWKDNDRLKREAQSAARTALLEAAEEADTKHKQRDGVYPTWYQVSRWLTTRAGGPRT